MTKTWVQTLGATCVARHDLEGVVGPLVDEVSGDAAVFEPEVPAAVVLAIVHPGEDRADQARPWAA